MRTDGRPGGVLTSHVEELHSIPMIPLWFCSVVMLTLIFDRFMALRARRVLDPALGRRVVELAGALRIREAREEARKSNTVVGRAWAQGLHEFLLGDVRIEEALTNATALAMKPLKRNLQGIATIAVIAPLLGLLGTVVGMVMVFDEIQRRPEPRQAEDGRGDHGGAVHLGVRHHDRRAGHRLRPVLQRPDAQLRGVRRGRHRSGPLPVRPRAGDAADEQADAAALMAVLDVLRGLEIDEFAVTAEPERQ
jgi:hypothetical protein